MRVLTVTGASGYLGGRLVGHAAGDPTLKVRPVVRRATPWLPDPVQVERLDLDADRAVSGSNAVIHLAGANEVGAAMDPNGSLEATVSAARSVAEACGRNGVARLVYVSTVHVYGRSLQPGAIIDEETVAEPLSPYAAARLAAEDAIQECSGATDVVILRLSNAVGAPAHPSVERWSLIGNDLSRQVACGQPIVLKSSGQQWRDFVAISDVVEVLAAAATAETIPPATYNLGSGSPTTIRQFAELVRDVAQTRGFGHHEIVAPEPGPNPPQPYHVSVEKLSSVGHRATTPLDDAITETLLFCRDNRQLLCADGAVGS